MASIEISRPGLFKSAERVDVNITPEILSEVVKTYDPKKFEAQLVIGHPDMAAPSFGGVRALSFGNGTLEAEVDPTDNARDLVDKKHYKAVSASFYTPNAPNNPTPGKWHLRHVGLLGATPPAVSGLRQLSFAEAEEGVLTFGDLPAYAGSTAARLFRSIRDFFIEKHGKEEADRVLPDWELESLRSMSQRAEEKSDNPGGTPALSFAEPGKAATSSQPSTQEKATMKTPEQLQAELDASQAKLRDMQAKEAKRASEELNTAHVSFAQGLVDAGKWPAAAKDVLVATLNHVAKPDGVVSFGEGDAAKPLHVVLQEQLTALPPNVSFGEFAKGGTARKEMSDQQVATRAAGYQERRQKAGRPISIAQAVEAVNAGTDNDC